MAGARQTIMQDDFYNNNSVTGAYITNTIHQTSPIKTNFGFDMLFNNKKTHTVINLVIIV